MKIAVCSDIHDNIWVLERALPGLRRADRLIFCGDFCAPFTLVQLAEGFPGPIHVVWGNNDGDKDLLTRQAGRFPQVVLHGEQAEIEVDGVALAVTHYPEKARDLAGSGRYRIVCYGHDHQAHDEQVNGCLLLNPGELMGRFGTSTYALLDPVAGTVEWCRVPPLSGGNG
ncbi:MAG: metallophosphoesterase [Candidatus Latescibacterota bacterium]